MARRATQFALSQLAAADAIFYTVPAGSYAEVLSITLANTSAAGVLITMRYTTTVPVLRKTIAAGDSYTERRFDVLTAGQTLRLQGATNTFAVVSGVLVTP